MLHLFNVFHENKDSDNCAKLLQEEGCVVDIQLFFWRRCRGGEVNGTHTPSTKLFSGAVAGEVSA